ncbi:MAG TPA: hypothetical protein VFS27_07115 [Blastocatellia bacterium]|nr:hypothetical protein [Blastocatellia bacterium]
MKNIEKKIFNFGLCLCLALANVIAVQAGGAIETIDITNAQASPILRGHVIAKVIGIKWDARSIPVQYSMNNTLDPIPNPLDDDDDDDDPVLTLAQAQTALQASCDTWNQIPTSFIEMNITGTTANSGFAGFDFVNEVTFRSDLPARASSFSISLMADVTFEDGDRIDMDDDPDVSSAITVCTDVDGDGDIEFPAGFYKAGTILDNDVQFNTNTAGGTRYTVGDEALDTNMRSADLIAVATHEFGHSHGLTHVMDNQISDTNGNSSVMFQGGVDTDDPDSEKARRSLGSDDIAWSSYFYPEGSAMSGPASLQPGDKAFDEEYGLIEGELRHGLLNQPIAGGSVFAIDYLTGKFVASGFSGNVQTNYNPTTGDTRILINNPAFHILNGKYVIPVPRGIYAVGVEPVDGSPTDANNINRTCRQGVLFGQQNFNEEFYNRSREDAREVRLGEKFPVLVLPGLKLSSGIDIVTSDSININNFGDRNAIGNTAAAPGQLYAVQIPASQITEVNPSGGLLIQGVAFDTAVVDASVVPVFAKAVLTRGTVNGSMATIDLARPLAEKKNFVGQDGDMSPFYFLTPRLLGAAVLKGIERGEIQNLFIVLQVPTTTPFPGVSGLPPLIGLNRVGPPNCQPNDPRLCGLSFVSRDGGATFVQVTNFNYRFSLIVSKPLGEP